MKSIQQLLLKYKRAKLKSFKKVKFSGVDKKDVYNITAPFKYKRTNYILGRVEERESKDSTIMFFKKKKNSQYWQPDLNLPTFKLEDPAIVKIKNLFVFSGVEVKEIKGKRKWRAVFYKGSELNNLKKFAVGPWGMKDIRLIELSDKKIGVFTRPQGKKGRRGKIGFTIIESLQKLKPQKITRAPLIKGQFSRGEWGGVNSAYMLKNGLIGVLGHIAKFSKDKKNKFYYPLAFVFNYFNLERSSLKILIRRGELPEGEAKKPSLYNVIFPGGLIRKENNSTKLYLGVGDAESYEVTIEDPFSKYEKNLD